MVTPARPVELVCLALGQLARKAGVAAAAGRPWPVDVLLERVVSYVESARWPPGQEPPRPAVAYAKPDRAPPPRVNRIAVAAGFAAITAAVGPMHRPVPRPFTDPVGDLLAMVPAPEVRPAAPKRADPPTPPVSLDEFMPFVE